MMFIRFLNELVVPLFGWCCVFVLAITYSAFIAITIKKLFCFFYKKLGR